MWMMPLYLHANKKFDDDDDDDDDDDVKQYGAEKKTLVQKTELSKG